MSVFSDRLFERSHSGGGGGLNGGLIGREGEVAWATVGWGATVWWGGGFNSEGVFNL